MLSKNVCAILRQVKQIFYHLHQGNIILTNELKTIYKDPKSKYPLVNRKELIS